MQLQSCGHWRTSRAFPCRPDRRTLFPEVLGSKSLKTKVPLGSRPRLSRTKYNEEVDQQACCLEPVSSESQNCFVHAALLKLDATISNECSSFPSAAALRFTSQENYDSFLRHFTKDESDLTNNWKPGTVNRERFSTKYNERRTAFPHLHQSWVIDPQPTPEYSRLCVCSSSAVRFGALGKP